MVGVGDEVLACEDFCYGGWDGMGWDGLVWLGWRFFLWLV